MASDGRMVIDPNVFRSTHEELEYTRTVLGTAWWPGVGGLIGFVLGCGINFMNKRPVFSGVQRHVLTTALGTGVGLYVLDSKEKTAAQRDAIYHHYMSLHPDDFPCPERRQYKDLLDPWVPIR